MSMGQTGHAGPVGGGGSQPLLPGCGHSWGLPLVFYCPHLFKPGVCNKLPRLLCLLGKEFEFVVPFV